MKRINKATKLDVINQIYKHFKKLKVSRDNITQAVDIIITQLVTELLENRCIIVDGFGTLNPCSRKTHMANNINNHEVCMLLPKKTIKFFPHSCFYILAKSRKKEHIK
jgi:nucleoid DNA-binding protein